MARKRRTVEYVVALFLGVLMVGTLGYSVDVARADIQPDVLLILTDDQRWDTLFAMPNVQALAAQGVQYNNAIATNPLCCPNRSSILTGNYSHTTGVMANEGAHGGFNAFDDSYTIATQLQLAGYNTGLVGKYLNGYPLDSGYVPPGWNTWDVSVPNGDDTGKGHGMMTTDQMADLGVQFLTGGEGPKFLYFSTHNPHMPAVPEDRHVGLFNGYKYPNRPSFNEKHVRDKPRYIRKTPRLTRDHIRWLNERTERQLETLLSIDEAVGRLLDAQAQRGRPALVIFTSDNGYAFGEHRWTVKVAPYEESIRVPLVVSGLGLEPGTQVDSLVAGLDLAPTIAEYAGADLVAEGTPLESVEPGSWLMLEHYRTRTDTGPNSIPSYCGVRTEYGKYVRYAGGFEEHYNLLADPYELQNRPHTDQAVALRRLAKRACVENLPPDMHWR